MGEPSDNLVFTLPRRMDVRLGRMESDIADICGRLQRLDTRSIRTGELDHDILRIDHRLDEPSRRLGRLEDADVPAPREQEPGALQCLAPAYQDMVSLSLPSPT